MDNRSNQISAEARQGERQVSPLNGWATVEGLVPQLSACLALVRPVGMNDDAAAEWLAPPYQPKGVGWQSPDAPA